MNKTTRSARLEQFTIDQDAPEGVVARLLCEDHRGTYTIPFPCCMSQGEWLNERTGEPIDADVIGWREWRKNEASAWQAMTQAEPSPAIKDA